MGSALKGGEATSLIVILVFPLAALRFPFLPSRYHPLYTKTNIKQVREITVYTIFTPFLHCLSFLESTFGLC